MRIFLLNKKSLAFTIGGFFAIACLTLIFFQVISLKSASVPAQAIYQGNSGQKIVAICVNVDWGEESLQDMLEKFKKHKVRVTFFVTGQWAEKNPELVKQMNEAGHSIQNHGYKHLHFNQLSYPQIKEQIMKTEKIVEQLTGKKTIYFASPYGEYNNNLISTVNEINYSLIMWSIDTVDWELPSADTIVKRVMNKMHNDAIILMHPTKPTLEALPDLLTQIEKQGYQMQTLDKIIIPSNDSGQDENEKADS